jgi:hypothetical protein
VIDKSGSMGQNDRISLARQAAIAVVDTLSDYDWVGVVLFNNEIEVYKNTLRPATPDNKGDIMSYITNNLVEGGGTNFQDSLSRAFDMLGDSLNNGESSMCMRAVMFLTDGQADFFDEDYTKAKERIKALSIALFTYALGDGADTTITKNLACQNRGIFYNIPDRGNVAGIMSSYFQYFAYGTRTCSVRWIEYRDTITNSNLLAGCLPFYGTSETQGKAPLRGVGCVDLNVVADLDEVKRQATYPAFQCQLEQISMMCEPLYLRDVDLADIRASFEAAETCPGDTPGQYGAGDGYCVDPECVDNIAYVDRHGYHCDQWVGEDCTLAVEDFGAWGYTQADEDAIVANCPYSCLQCSRKQSLEQCTSSCDDYSGNVPCMERRKPCYPVD